MSKQQQQQQQGEQVLPDSVAGRIQRLLALAHGTHDNGDEERAAAMAKVLKLLAEHNLTMEAAQTIGSKPTEKRTSDIQENKRDYLWVRHATHAVAQLYFCRVFTTKTGKDRSAFTWVGLEGNIGAAQAVIEWVIKSIEAEARRDARKAPAGTSPNTWTWSFCKGAAAQVIERCKTARKNAEDAAADEPGTGMVLASYYKKEYDANTTYLAEPLSVQLRKSHAKSRNTLADAYDSGKEYGNKVGLGRPVEGRAAGGGPRLLEGGQR